MLSAASPSFFSGLVQAPGAYRLGQGIAFDSQLFSYGGGFQTFIESFLRLIQYRIGQYRRPASPRLFIKPRRSSLAIPLHRPLYADEGDAKGAGNIRLFGVAVDAKLGRDHAKGGRILFGVNEYRHVPVEVGHWAIPSFKGQFRGDVLHAIRKQGQVHLRHRGHLSSGGRRSGHRLAAAAA